MPLFQGGFASSIKSVVAGIALAGLMYGAALPAKVHAQSSSFPAVTEHTLAEHPAGPVQYQARVESIRVQDSDGKDSADIVATSYLAKHIANSESENNRPVIFFFNGGPIVPSVYLHLGVFAPQRIQFLAEPNDPEFPPTAEQPWQLVSNPDSIIDIADLVYVDPASTGFSRVVEGRDEREFFTVDQDARKVADFIGNWVEKHGREGSPVYVFGESYGTMRAPVTAHKLHEHYPYVNIRGVMLFGQAVNMIEYSQRPNNIVSYLVSLPTLSLIARYHGKSAYPELSEAELYDKAWQYATDHYLPALFAGTYISESQLHEVATELENLTGISREFYIEHRLKINKQQFRTELLEGEYLGFYDARYTGPFDSEQPIDPSGPLGQAYLNAFSEYVTDVLQVETDKEYLPRADVGGLAGWEWGGNSPFSHFNYAAHLDALFAETEDFRLYVGSGYYDLSTTAGSAEYLVQMSDWPLERVMLRNYTGGHMAYTVDESARAMSQDIREFLGKAL